jgi:L,D-transpeptidase catalytic domain
LGVETEIEFMEGVMNKIMLGLVSCCFLFLNTATYAKYYAKSLCNNPDYTCVKVKRGQSWEKLFPDAKQRDIVKRVNRMNTRLRTGQTLAIPKNLSKLSVYDVAPFPRYIDDTDRKIIFIDQKQLAWGAYDEDGELVWWGPISSGRDYCSDVGQDCSTPDGAYKVVRKQGIGCVSSKYPLDTQGGAAMPYCMHFYGGFAMHGSYTVPGYRDSHGCVRMFIEDARWLNREFVELPGSGHKATRVIVDGLSL